MPYLEHVWLRSHAVSMVSQCIPVLPTRHNVGHLANMIASPSTLICMKGALELDTWHTTLDIYACQVTAGTFSFSRMEQCPCDSQ